MHRNIEGNDFKVMKILRFSSKVKRIFIENNIVFFCHFQHLKIPDSAKKELTYLIQMLETVIKKKYLNSNIDELSESVQNSYNKFADFINSPESQFAHVSPELFEQIIDFFEKVVMTRNHKCVFWILDF